MALSRSCVAYRVRYGQVFYICCRAQSNTTNKTEAKQSEKVNWPSIMTPNSINEQFSDFSCRLGWSENANIVSLKCFDKLHVRDFQILSSMSYSFRIINI